MRRHNVKIAFTIKGDNPKHHILCKGDTLTFSDVLSKADMTLSDGSVKKVIMETEIKIEVLGFDNER